MVPLPYRSPGTGPLLGTAVHDPAGSSERSERDSDIEIAI